MGNPFPSFPKKRPALPAKLKRIYLEHYKQNRGGEYATTRFTQRLEEWMHKKVAEDIGRSDAPVTLEIGAGTLNHLKYENGGAAYDIVEPFAELFRESPNIKMVRRVYKSLSAVKPVQSYDRVISIATFEHVSDLPKMVAKIGLLLKKGGNLRVGIPSEGEFLWRIGCKLTTGLEFRIRYNMDYGQLMRYEHLNKSSEIRDVLCYFFRDVERKVFGLSPSLSLYQFFSCKTPDVKRCRLYVSLC